MEEVEMNVSDVKREFLRHTLATVAYRGGKAIRNVPEGFADLKISDTSRTPLQILAHINDLCDWALALARGEKVWTEAMAESWASETERFFRVVKSFDDFLASADPLGSAAENLFQGPIADALTHVGQIALLRRVGGQPVRGENYFKAEIASGRVGPDQATPRREFD